VKQLEYPLNLSVVHDSFDDGKSAPQRSPLFSVIVPAYESPTELLRACINSMKTQVYQSWELIIVDDASRSPAVSEMVSAMGSEDKRIKLISRQINGNISRATNDGLNASVGEFVLFLDHDDELLPDALLRFSQAIVKDPGTDVWYSDQVTCDEDGKQIHHFFKPDWSPIYFMGVMYVGHLLGVRRQLALAIGAFDPTFDGVQDFEFMLRLSEKTNKIDHLRGALYKWRAIAGSIALDGDAKSGIEAKQAEAVRGHLERTGRSWRVESDGRLPHRLRIMPGDRTATPPVSIIIPSKDMGTMVERCLTSIYRLTDYPTFEVIVVDNGTVDPIALAAFKRFPVKIVEFCEPFNFSRANNLGVREAKHDFLLFLNNDTEVEATDWLRHLCLYFEDREVGAVGPILLYPDRTVQHAGVVLGARGTADHVMRFFPEDVDGYGGSLACSREVSAVTAACMMMRKDIFVGLGGFSEDFATHYQDVDLCLKIRDAGYRIICAASPRLIHHESSTRAAGGYDMVDRAILIDRWHHQITTADPYYNAALSLEKLDYSLRESG
jgi:O-antigen biosynthesis protein